MAAAEADPDVRCFASRQLMADDPTPARRPGRRDVAGRASPTAAATAAAIRARRPRRGVLGLRRGDADRPRAVPRAGRLRRAAVLLLRGRRPGLSPAAGGEPTLVVPDAVVRHVGSASTGGPRSDFAVFHGTRNRFWVFVKDTPPLLFWLTLPLHLLATRGAVRRHTSPAARSTRPGAASWRRDGRHRRRAAGPARGSGPAHASAPGRSLRAMTWSPLDLRGAARCSFRPWRPTRPAGA